MTSAFGGGHDDSSSPCPCGSGNGYDRCCAPLHRGERVAESAEALMRSRYTAYARGLEEYVLATWHPATRPAGVPMDPALQWIRLEVLDTAGGGAEDTTGEVEFTASYRERGREGRLHERSRFSRRGGRWLYLDGTVD